MNKFKRFGVSILSLGLVLALNPVTTFAAEPETSVVTSESNAIGGWSEEDGYFVNPQAYSKAMEDGTTYASPKHTDQNLIGKRRKTVYFKRYVRQSGRYWARLLF